MFNEAIRNEFTKAKRLANLIEEVGNHLAILFEQDNLEMEHFELSEGQTGWIYVIKLKDNDVDFSGVVEYGTCVERLVLNIYEDVWNHEILPESEMEEAELEENEELRAQIDRLHIELANLAHYVVMASKISLREDMPTKQDISMDKNKKLQYNLRKIYDVACVFADEYSFDELDGNCIIMNQEDFMKMVDEKRGE